MKLAVPAAVAVPAALVLFVGVGLGGHAGGAAIAPGQPSGTSLPQPAPVPGAAEARCANVDPTGTGGCVTPATAWLVQQMEAAFGLLTMTCWDRHAWNPSSDHPRGRACDVSIGAPGSFPPARDASRGHQIAEWLRANADPLRVAYVIWAGRIWSASRADEGWRPYGGGGVYDPADPTGGHYDHVHVSTRS